MAPETIDEIVLSGDVNRSPNHGSPNPAVPTSVGTSHGGRRSSEPPETHDSDIGKCTRYKVHRLVLHHDFCNYVISVYNCRSKLIA